MMTDLSRRTFIKRVAQMAALAALGPMLSEVYAAEPLADDLDWQKAPCRFCGTGCGVVVGLKGGRVVAVQGDINSPVNRGLLCAKGYHAGGALYGRDRLTSPQIRKNGKLVDVSWDEAIDTIAKHINEKPDTFSIYGSGQWTIGEGYTAMKFIKGGLRNNHIDPNARLCMASAVVGFIKTFGVDEPSGCYKDLDECDTVITWGNNWAEMHPMLFSRVFNRRSAGEKITYIDLATRRTRSTDAADHYMEFVPQTDLAIANCICHQLLERGTYDKEFVNSRVVFKTNDGKPMSLEEYKGFLKDYNVKAVSELSGISEGNLRLLGDTFSDPKKKVLSLWCMGMNQHTRGTWINNLVYNVHLLAGKIGKPGSTPLSLTGQPSACGTCREVGTLAHALPGGRVVKNADHRKHVEDVWNCEPGAINPKPGFHTVRMFEGLASGEITGMWVQVTNPAQTMPNLHKNLAHAEDRFLVVSDVYPTVTTRLATVVLPSALWVEKNGVFGNTERRTQQWFKMVNPPGQARDDVWQMIAVAHRLYELGYENMKDRNGNFLLSVYDDAGKEIEAWKWEVFNDPAVNVDKALFNEYRQLTLLKHKDIAPYDVYVKSHGLTWPVVQRSDGTWKETDRRFVEGEDPYVPAGEGISFYMSKVDKKSAIAWARPYEAPPEVPDAEFPFWLCTGRVVEHWHSGTMTGRIKELHQAMPKAYVDMNPQDAKRMRLRDGDWVQITSRRGKIKLQVSLLGRSIPAVGSIFVPFFDETKLINEVTLDEYCPMSKEPDYKKCAVKVEKLS